MSALSMHTEFTNSVMNPIKPTTPKMDVSVIQKQFVLFPKTLVMWNYKRFAIWRKGLEVSLSLDSPTKLLFSKHDPSFSRLF